jgi:hypothetical protein
MAKSKMQMANGFVDSSTGRASGSRQSAVSPLYGPSASEGELLAGYRAMASDQEQEAEALEWCEGLIGDAIPQEG